MHTKNPERFLKIAAFTIGFAILAGGTILSEKNTNFASKIDASLYSASTTNIEDYSIAKKIGTCEQTSASQPNEKILVEVENLDKILGGEAPLDTQFVNPISAAILGKRLEATTLMSGEKYEFAVVDGQTSFWKCVLENHPLFVTLEVETISDFLSDTQIFADEVDKFGYAISEQKIVDQFLNFVSAPKGEKILETTAVNSNGDVFFKIFEIELIDGDYNELRKSLRTRVGVTNLRPAVFGGDSYYWMWGENNKMAASVLPLAGKVFGVSYQTAHFKGIRRVMESLQTKFKKLTEKIDYLKNLDERFENLTINEFEKMGEKDFGFEVWRQLQNLDSTPSNLGANILEVSPLTEFEIPENYNFEPLEIPEIVEENLDTEIPASL